MGGRRGTSAIRPISRRHINSLYVGLPLRRIYITHCSFKKDDSLRGTGSKVFPWELYVGQRIQAFMRHCRARKVEWAVFSDLYGVWFPDVKHKWYEKHPGSVTKEEFEALLHGFNRQLSAYNEIWFYHHPKRLHPLYRKLLRVTRLRDRVRKFSHCHEI